MNKKDRALDLAAAIEAIAAFRVDISVSASHTWAYYAKETNSWWLITEDELRELATTFELDVNKWAENPASTAEEYGRRAPRRAS